MNMNSWLALIQMGVLIFAVAYAEKETKEFNEQMRKAAVIISTQAKIIEQIKNARIKKECVRCGWKNNIAILVVLNEKH